MKVLLDTQAFLWFIMGDPRLSAAARAAIEDPANDKRLSIALVWEIAIKVSLGKLTLTEPFDVLLPREIGRNGFRLLPIELSYAAIVASLPFHHRDPFDRLLIAQATGEGCVTVSSDSVFDAYAVKRIW